MRIEQSSVALTSRREAASTCVTRGTMETWVGDRRGSGDITRSFSAPGDHGNAAIASISAQALVAERAAQGQAARAAAAQKALADLRTIALAARAKAAPTSGAGPTIDDGSDPTVSDPNLRALIQLIEHLTGRKVHLVRPSDMQAAASATAQAQAAGRQAAQAVAAQATGQTPPQPAGWGVEVHVEQVHQETETTAYTAAGTVTTADGRSIAFDFGVSMHREETQTATLDIKAGDATRKIDPIALNLGGGPVALSDTRTDFDLDDDGASDRIALPAAGTYFVALDRNGNGTIDSGAELFGPTSGNGFSELQALDEDGNGWIDEGDSSFANLRLWASPVQGTTSLTDAGVGALYVGGNVSTQFDIKGTAGDSLGQVVSSSVYLAENGTPGALSQVDLTA